MTDDRPGRALRVYDQLGVADQRVEAAREYRRRGSELRRALDDAGAAAFDRVVDDLAHGRLQPASADFVTRVAELAALRAVDTGGNATGVILGNLPEWARRSPLASAAHRATAAAWALLREAAPAAEKTARKRLADAEKVLAGARKALGPDVDERALATEVAERDPDIVGRWWAVQLAQSDVAKIRPLITELIALELIEPNAEEKAALAAADAHRMNMITGRYKLTMADETARQLGQQGLATDHAGAAIVVTGR